MRLCRVGSGITLPHFSQTRCTMLSLLRHVFRAESRFAIICCLCGQLCPPSRSATKPSCPYLRIVDAAGANRFMRVWRSVLASLLPCCVSAHTPSFGSIPSFCAMSAWMDFINILNAVFAIHAALVAFCQPSTKSPCSTNHSPHVG